MELIYLNVPEIITRGRICSSIAKVLLNNENIAYLIKNPENIVVSGSKSSFQKDFKAKRARRSRRWGPFYPTKENEQIRRCLRGMINRNTIKGKKAYKRFFTEGTVEKIKRVLGKQGIEVKKVSHVDFNLKSVSKYSPSIYVEK